MSSPSIRRRSTWARMRSRRRCRPTQHSRGSTSRRPASARRSRPRDCWPRGRPSSANSVPALLARLGACVESSGPDAAVILGSTGNVQRLTGGRVWCEPAHDPRTHRNAPCAAYPDRARPSMLGLELISSHRSDASNERATPRSLASPVLAPAPTLLLVLLLLADRRRLDGRSDRRRTRRRPRAAPAQMAVAPRTCRWSSRT